MNWYDDFNRLEGVLWWLVALGVLGLTKRRTSKQHALTWLAAAGFVVFGVSDWLEVGCEGRLPLWLWALKIGCGVVILGCHFAWTGWQPGQLRSREFRFAMVCLAAVCGILLLQAVFDQVTSRFAM
jgi:hypothetical protein